MRPNLIRPTRAAVVAIVAAVVAVLLPGVAHAEPPSNDDIDNATELTLPFTENVDLPQASAAPDDPDRCIAPGDRTVWYSYTATEDVTLRFDTDNTMTSAIFTGSRGALRFVPGTCATDWYPRSFPAHAGTTYYVVLAGADWYSRVQFSAAVVPPPVNDHFDAAQPIGTLPFTSRLTLAAATSEAGEPSASCDLNPGSPSVWYSFTPEESGAFVVDADSFGGNYTPRVGAYTGTSLADLTEVACIAGQNVVRFDANRTVYLQFTAAGTGARDLSFGVWPARPLEPNLQVSPAAPSVFDDVRFDGYSWDPEGDGTSIEELDLGDGTVAHPQSSYVYHRYTADGDYTVRLDIRGSGGRTATISKVVSVRTHDVAVTGFAAPATGRVGMTRQVSVDVANTRYAENVTVTLYRGDSTGYQAVRALTGPVPAQAGRTTRFTFDYTFTDADLAEGTVVFKAVAEAGGVRDALPSDNTVIAPATRVRPATS
ncbi:PKD domain-containing protein [Actinophytocola oryzae]|uniref:PKD domain-containing protein n=1 Tax=Actinophytocola oryzae TaxID=502181 RepID=A0A4V3FRC7_9PSEU|nr:PKD domain-containing protein [Actinophytocola oryzae]TDV43081.1 hypothetical protein CLV71_11615 [Actinophytocola oryzae]